MEQIYSHFNTACSGVRQLYVNLMSDSGRLYTQFLPKNGESRLAFISEDGLEDLSFIHFDQNEEGWSAVCDKGARFSTVNVPVSTQRKLSKCELVEIKKHEDHYYLYVEPMPVNGNLYRSYDLNGSLITIGSSPRCSIVYKNPFVEPVHATIKRDGQAWTVQSNSERQGVYCNGKYTSRHELKIGDIIFVMGLKIILGAGFLSINDLHGAIDIDPASLCIITPERRRQDLHFALPLQRVKKREPFSCPPRKRLALSPKDIVLEGPPMSMKNQSIPLLLRMGSSMVMGGSAALAGNYTMLLSSVFFPFLTQKYTEKEKKEYEERRTEKYEEYLEKKREEIKREKGHEEFILRKNYPDFDRVLHYSLRRKEHLWERRKTADDFLHIRVGYGSVPLISKIDYPIQRFTLEDDELEQEMRSLAESPVVLENVPILFDFVKYNIGGFTGDPQQVFSFLRQILIRICLLHSYDEVKIVFLGDETEKKDMDFIRYLPHSWDESRSVRLIAENVSEACQIGEFLKNEFEQDLEKPRELKEILKNRPYYIVCATSKKLLESVEVIKTVLQGDKNCGMSIIAACADLPKECMVQFDFSSREESVITYLNEPERSEEHFHADSYDLVLLQKSIKELSNTSLRITADSFALPKSVSFLELFKVGRVEHLSPQSRWRESNPVLSLAAPVGVSSDGSPFVLDLHQKVHGPHGLVAGMTGSGKSEFLISYILSMAINFHPDEVSFVIIDYKGGGLAGAFDNPEQGIHLPHLVGTITNLDGATIQRSLLSIQSELTRRQRVFNEAKALTGEATIDIYSYQRMYREKRVPTPMSHLFIICDEFAELKQQQPEFMDQLISIARIGRSLGIHLILATQKPAGIVNDQIRSNSRFRVCLKVQDKSDSMDMLMRPEAAGLKETGRFYMQVGYNEQFSLGQSAWSGAPYTPQDSVVVQTDERVQFIDSLGQPLLELKPDRKCKESEGTQLTAVVKLLSKLAEELNILPRSLWKPALPAFVESSELEALVESDTHLRVGLGMVDDPANQKQFPFYYDFNKSTNLLVVGSAGSGKSTLVHTILRSLLRRFSPEQFQFYALDFSSRLLRSYNRLPHCGGVLLEEDSDSFNRFFDMIQSIIIERKKLFSELELDDYDTINAIHPLPLILVIVDNFSGFTATKVGDNISYKLPAFLKDGLAYGIKFIITDGHFTSIPSRIRREMGDIITLHLKDKYEYSDALSCKTSFVPLDNPGRGLVAWEGVALEFQAAMDSPKEDDQERSRRIKDEISAIEEKSACCKSARRLPVVETTAEYVDFASQFKSGRIPLGFSMKDSKAVALPMKQFSVLRVYCGNTRGTLPLAENFLYAISRERGSLYIVCRENDSLFDREGDQVVKQSLFKDARIFMSSSEEITNLLQELQTELDQRKSIFCDLCVQRGLDPSEPESAKACFQEMQSRTKPVFLFIESYADFCRNIDLFNRLVFGRFPETFACANFYMICFFEPDDGAGLATQPMYYGFASESPSMFFGGNYDHQILCELPRGTGESTDIPFNYCLMYYQQDFYALQMPCGNITSNDHPDEDDQSIF